MRAQLAVLIMTILSTTSAGLVDSPQAPLSLSSNKSDYPPIVELDYATYLGNYNSTSNITDFYGIRYAAPPTGKRRFQSPRDPLNETGIRMANQPPIQCPQASVGSNSHNPFRCVLEGSCADFPNFDTPGNQTDTPEIEDCLYLNIQVSGEINPDAKMPVLFWIHGGGYVGGNITNMSSAYLISQAGGGIVAVEVQYRLGIFGFLPGAEVKKKGVLNAGLLDQQKALQWVQKYIGFFGGDPNQVTIWGESAGAGSVLQHLVAHGGNTRPSLFLRAIMGSTFLPAQYHFDDKVPEYIYNETAHLTGCSDKTDVFACLVAANASVLEAVNEHVSRNGFRGTFVNVPVVDGEFIVERPIETILKGNLNSDTILMMTNADEGFSFVNGSTRLDCGILEAFIANLMPTFNITQVRRVADLYREAGFNNVEKQAAAIIGESIFVCPTHAILNSFNGASRKGYFAVPPAWHGVDLAYYFPEMGERAFNDSNFQASFIGALTGMIKSGDPNAHPVEGIITPPWPTYGRGSPDVEMLFNCTEACSKCSEPNITSIPTDPGILARCEMWQELAVVIPQ